MYDLIIIGAGPGGIALAAEAQASGVDTARTRRAIEVFTGRMYKGAFASGLAVSLLYSSDADKMARDVALWAQNAAHRKVWEIRRSDFEPMISREREAVWQLKRIARKLA